MSVVVISGRAGPVGLRILRVLIHPFLAVVRVYSQFTTSLAPSDKQQTYSNDFIPSTEHNHNLTRLPITISSPFPISFHGRIRLCPA